MRVAEIQQYRLAPEIFRVDFTATGLLHRKMQVRQQVRDLAQVPALLVVAGRQHDQAEQGDGEAEEMSGHRGGHRIGKGASTGIRSGCSRRFFSRSEEHTSALQSLMRNSYSVFCLNKKQQTE